MEVGAQLHAAGRLAGRGNAVGHRPGIGRPDGVGQGDLLDADRRRVADDAGDPRERDLPLVGTTEGGRQGQADRRSPVGAAVFGDRRQHLHLLGGGGALVALAEGVAGGDHHIGLVAAGRLQPLPTLQVQDEADARAAVPVRQQGHQLLGPGHLRHPLGIDEGGRLHAVDPARLQAMDELHPFLDGQADALGLQPVPRAHLDDLDLAAHCCPPD